MLAPGLHSAQRPSADGRRDSARAFPLFEASLGSSPTTPPCTSANLPAPAPGTTLRMCGALATHPTQRPGLALTCTLLPTAGPAPASQQRPHHRTHVQRRPIRTRVTYHTSPGSRRLLISAHRLAPRPPRVVVSRQGARHLDCRPATHTHRACHPGARTACTTGAPRVQTHRATTTPRTTK